MSEKDSKRENVSPTRRRKITLTDGKVYYAYNVRRESGLVHFQEEGGGHKTFSDNVVSHID